MSSLAAARADNFYYPPGFDPNKHKSLNKYNGQHPLRERARKIDQGILVIRFEVPFNLFCSKCGEMIGKGVRFNAEKKQVGNYYSTKIWSFSMRHHCGSKIVIQTDPKNAEYLVQEGARRKAEEYTAEDAAVEELADEEERSKLAADPLYRLEHQHEEKQRVVPVMKQLSALRDLKDSTFGDDMARNRELRAQFRKRKKQDAEVDAKRKSLGLADGIKLLPEAETDELAATVAFFRNDSQFKNNQRSKRRQIMSESIFTGEGGASSNPSTSDRTGSAAAAAAHSRAAVPPGLKPPQQQLALVGKHGFGRPVGAAQAGRQAKSGGKSLHDKAALLAKRNRLQPGVKLGLSAPSR